MSGAKKKLAQKEAVTQMGLTEKEKKAQKEAAAKKRNSILGIVVGVILLVLAAALLVWNSGVITRHTTALEINGHKYTVADLDYWYHMMANQTYQQEQSTASFYQQLADQGYDMGDLNYTPRFDINGDYKTQYVDDAQTQTYHEYFLEQAKTQLTTVTAMADAANAAGYTLSEDSQKELDDSLAALSTQAKNAGCASSSAYLRLVFGRSVNEKVYRENVKLSVLASDYQNTTLADLTDYSDEDMKAFYDQNAALYNSYDYDYAYFDGTPVIEPAEDGTTPEATDAQKSEAMAAAKEKAEGLLNAMKAAPAEGETAPTFATAAAVYGISDTSRTRRLAVGNFKDTVFADWLMDSARKDGDIEMFESEGNGYYVIQFHDSYFYDEPTVDVRHILVMAEMDEGAEKPTQAQMDAAHDEAEELMKQFNLGEKTAAAFGEMAEEHSDDGRTDDGALRQAGGLYSGVHKGDMVQNFNDWIFDEARKEGDVGLVVNEGPGYYGWHVVYFQASHEPEWLSTAKTNRSSEDTTAWNEATLAGYEAVEASGFSQVGQ